MIKVLTGAIALGLIVFGFTLITPNGTAEMEKSTTSSGEVLDETMKTGDDMMKDDMMKTDDSMSDADMMKGDMEEKAGMTDSVLPKGDMAEGEMKKDTEEAAMTKPGSYEPYSEALLARAETGDVVLFFRASWCPTCRALDADIIKNLGAIPSGLTILDVNYDTATELKKRYGVTYQHTFVQVDSKGNQITKWSGSPSLADIVTKVE